MQYRDNKMLKTVVATTLALLCAPKRLRGHYSCVALKDVRRSERGSFSDASVHLPPSEMQALEDLYDSTNGINWQWKPASTGVAWNFSDPEANPCIDKWQGVDCLYDGGEYQNVVSLNLANYSLAGPLPDSLSNLSLLEEFKVGENSLNGTIPASLGNLSHLEVMEVYSNYLSGTIPASLGRLTLLLYLFVYSNELSGTIPATLSNLSQLLILHMGGNQLSGSIPAFLGDLSYLQNLYAYANELSGTIPASLGNLSHLLNLNVDINKLSGSIPASLGNLSQLFYLGVNSNKLSGPIPASLGNLSQLQYLYLDTNQLTGTVPASLGNVWRLMYLDLQSNKLRGSVPETLRNLSVLEGLSLDDNFLTGTLPSFIGNYSQLQYLTFSNNSLVGTIPESLGNLTELFEFSGARNRLTGTIPSSIARISKLISIFVDHNSLSGSLDRVFDPAVQARLVTIVVHNNQLTGTLPSAIFDLPSLANLVASTNCFHGQLPANICACTKLSTIVFDGLSSAPACKSYLLPGLSHSYTLDSSVHGTVPSCLFTLPALKTLHLSGNRFTGSIISDSTAVASGLTDLSLSHNQLTGTIPLLLQNKAWLVLDLSYNRLRGSLSSSIAIKVLHVNTSYINATRSVNPRMSLSLENNRLSGRIPHSVQTLQDVSILGTNTFSCKLDGSDLPQHDSGVSNYQCGSSEFDVPYYVWLGVCFLSAVLLLCALRFRSSLQRFGDINVTVNCCEKWLRCVVSCGVVTTNTGDGIGTLYRYQHIQRYCQELITVRQHMVVYTAVILVVLLPLYAALSHYYGTHLQAYAWTVSAAYLSGAVPFGLETALWLAILSLATCWIWVSSARASTGPALTPAAPGTSASRQQCVLIYALSLGLNIIIVGGVNVAYVYVSIYRSSQLLTFAQICMSFFKVIYNGIASTSILGLIVRQVTGKELQISGYATLRALSALVNNIVIPFMVVVVVSPSCFYNVFVPAPPVTADFMFEYCVSSYGADCLEYQDQLETAAYDPPFAYSYQCSSSLITYYAPAFVNLCIVSMFVMPMAHLMAVEALRRADKSTRWFQLLNRAVPATWKLPAIGETSDTTCLYFNPPREQLAQLNFVALIFTFGVVFPPLAAALAVTLVVCTVITKLKLGRLLQHVCDHDGGSIAQSVELACESLLSSALLKDFVGMLSVIACLFYTLFLFDTLGDAVGFHKAYWVLIVVPLLPVCAICGHRALGVHSPLHLAGQGTEPSSSAIEQPNLEMTALSSSVGDGAETFNAMLATQADMEA